MYIKKVDGMISVSNTKTDDALEYYPTTASTTEEFENLMLNRIIKSAFISINSTRTRSSTDTGDRTESQAQMGRSHSDPQSNSKPKSTLKKSSSEKTSFFGGVKKPKPEIVNKPASKPKVDIPEPKPAPIPVVPKAMSKKIQKQNDDIKNMFDDDDSKQETEIDVEVANVQEDASEAGQKVEEIIEPKPTVKVLKRRKVIKTETYVEGNYMKTKDIEEWESYYEDVEEDAMMNSKVIQKPVITKDSNLDAAGGKRKKAATTANGKLQQRGIGSFFSKK